jgi:CHAT domain-containing protein
MDSALHRGQRSVTRLSDGAGTRDAVLRALGVHDICHFACHGAANNADPLESYLQLADGRITVRDLLNQRLRGRLAVLAACESSVPYAQLPDEMVGLPATLLEAGVPGVVGTLWPVEELPTTLLMARFYELLLDRRIEPAAALHQAQSWLRTGTAGQFEAYLNSTAAGRSAWPYRHTGDAREDRFFAHPDCWAAFTYIGH